MDARFVAKVLVTVLVLTVFSVACRQPPGDDTEPPELPGIPRVSLLMDQLRREYASNSLVFMQDRVGQTVSGLGRIDRVLQDGTIVFRTDPSPDLWCTSASSAAVASLEAGMWVLFRGKVADLTEGRVLLKRCEFREFHWGSEWVGET